MIDTTSFFFNVTTTTGFNTYLHTLSLHDALPILAGPLRSRSSSAVPAGGAVPRADQGRMESPEAIHRPCKSALPFRSEEHTSELQSLMRSSYAVFCLKKKTKISIKRLSVKHAKDQLHSQSASTTDTPHHQH